MHLGGLHILKFLAVRTTYQLLKIDDLKLENDVMQQQNEDSISNLEKVERERNVTTWMNSVLLNLSELTCHGTNEKLLKTSMDEKEQCIKRAQDFAHEGILSIMY